MAKSRSINDCFKPLREGAMFELLEHRHGRLRIANVRIWLSNDISRVLLHRVVNDVYDDTDEIDLCMAIIEIDDVRFGCRTDEFHMKTEEMKADTTSTDKANIIKKLNEFRERCFSIHYGDEGSDSISIVTKTKDDTQVWTTLLGRLVKDARDALSQNRVCPEYWIKQIFRETDEISCGFLTFKKCKEALRRMNVVVADEANLKNAFNEANTDPRLYQGKPVLDENEFVKFYQIVIHHPVLDEIFRSLAGVDATEEITDQHIIPSSKLRDFLINTQNMKGLKFDYVTDLIRRHQGTKSNQPPLSLSFKGFRSLMVSDTFDIRIEEHRKINQRMDLPITAYWLKSSHNTYLRGNQLSSNSSIEAFRVAIAQGCVCIELDLWNGKNGEPIIKHGNTMTRKVNAGDVLRDGILPYAFLNDPYPLVLSLEDHLNDQQRQVFIRQMREIFGDRLYVVPDPYAPSSLPSPEDLKGKILLKAKKKQYGELANIYSTYEYSSDLFKTNIIPAVIGQTCSFSEHKINRIIHRTFGEILTRNKESVEKRREQVREHTTHSSVRVYPGWHRQLSGNFNPFDSMNVGVQMAAMNIQTKCSKMAMYAGRLRSNGDCGWVLKPEFLMNPTIPKTGPKRIELEIISAQNLPRAAKQKSLVVDPYVKVRIGGNSCDKQSRKTKRIKGNGLNPVWKTKMEFVVMNPDLAVIHFSVKHLEYRLIFKKTYILGSFALPVLSMGKGYRFVALQDKKLCRVPLATLFIKVDIKDWDNNMA